MEQAKRRCAFVLRHPYGPKLMESVAVLHELPSISEVLMYRTKSRRLEDLFPYILCTPTMLRRQVDCARVLGFLSR